MLPIKQKRSADCSASDGTDRTVWNESADGREHGADTGTGVGDQGRYYRREQVAGVCHPGGDGAYDRGGPSVLDRLCAWTPESGKVSKKRRGTTWSGSAPFFTGSVFRAVLQDLTNGLHRAYNP